MAEIAPAGGGPNRLFLVIALGLVGLLLLGLIAVGGILLIPRILQTSPPPTQRIAISTPTRVIAAAATEVPPTDTPQPSATFVVGTTPGVGETPGVTNTPTSTTPTGTPIGGTLPESGIGEDLLLLAGGVVLVMIIFAARRARSISSA